MTITDNDRRIGPTNGDGSNKTFTYDFKITAETDLGVYLKNTTSLVVTKQIWPTAFAVTGKGAEAGGTIVFVVAPTADEQVLILGESIIDQPTDVTVGEVFFQATTQEAFDRIVRLEQQLKETLDRCIRFEKFSTTAVREVEIKEPVAADDTFALTWDDANNRYIHSAALPTSTVVITTAGEDLIDDASAPDMLTTLGFSAFVKTLVDDATAAAFQATLGTDRITMLSEVVNKVTHTGAADVATFTDIDVSAQAPNARFAIMRVRIHDTNTASAVRSYKVSLRKKGTTPTKPLEVFAECKTGPTDTVVNIDRMCIVELDGDQILQYTFIMVSASAATEMDIEIEGFIL